VDVSGSENGPEEGSCEGGDDPSFLHGVKCLD
jgi:hypothetical protein